MKTTNRSRKFTLVLTCDVEIGQGVFEQAAESERNPFYRYASDEDLAEHVGLNLVRGLPLSGIDGFDDLSDDLAQVHSVEVENVAEDRPEDS